MVAIGAVHRAENRIFATRQLKASFDTSCRDGHAVAGLVASTARTAVRPNALEKRSRQVNSAIRSAIGLRRAPGIWEKDSVGDERERLPFDHCDCHQYRRSQKNHVEGDQSGLAPALGVWGKKLRYKRSESGLQGCKCPHQSSSYGATGASRIIFLRESGTAIER